MPGTNRCIHTYNHPTFTLDFSGKKLSSKAVQQVRSACLSIVLSETSLSYIVTGPQPRQLLLFQEYQMNAASYPMSSGEYLFEVKALLADLPVFLQPFQKTAVYIEDMKYTLVPSNLFDITRKGQYLSFNHELNDNEEVQVDFCTAFDAYVLFSSVAGLKSLLQSSLPDCRISHHTSLLLAISDKGMDFSSGRYKLFLSFRENCFDMLLLERKQLRFMNSFHCLSPNDMLYFFLNVLQQLNIIPTACEPVVCGKIEENSPELELLTQYVKKIHFGSIGLIAKEFLNSINKPKHYYYSLLNSPLCEL